MTRQLELERLLDAFLAEGHDEVADRVIDAALDQVDRTPQRRAVGMPRRFQGMPMFPRLAAAAAIGVLAVGGVFYLLRPGPSGVIGVPTPSPTAVIATTPSPTPVPAPTAKPDPTALTGPLGAGRQIHTATALADGRVLIAGGLDAGDQPLASVVLYDPRTGTFSPTGSMATARVFDTATLLADGRVLVTGGGPPTWVHPGPNTASAEVWDPRTGTFSPTGSMTITRQAQTATRLADGRVLIAGGDENGDHAVASAEIWDPRTGKFSPTGSMTNARAYHTATLLADGRVLVAGGVQLGWGSDGSLSTAEIYDPTSGTFSTTGSMDRSRAFGTATLLSDGRVLFTGGTDGAGYLPSAEVFDPRTGTFALTGRMSVARIYQAATLLADGRVLVVGGGGDYANRSFLASAEIWDPRTGTFTVTGSMTTPRTYETATLLADGRVLVAGGYGDLTPLPSAELFDPRTGTFTPAG